jgi:hypothetical protein
MLSYVMDRRFLVGAAVGFFIVPYITKNARGLLDKAKGAAS